MTDNNTQDDASSVDVIADTMDAMVKAFMQLGTVVNQNSNDACEMFNTITEQLATLTDAVHQLQLDVRDIEQRTRASEVQ